MKELLKEPEKHIPRLLWDMVKECGINDDLTEWFTKGE